MDHNSNLSSGSGLPSTRDQFLKRNQEQPVITQVYQDDRHYPNDDDEIDLRALWSVLLRRKGTIITIALLVFAMVVIFTLMKTPTYRASVTLKIDTESTQVLDYGVEKNQGQRVRAKDFYQTQYELLKSSSLARRTIDQLGLENSFKEKKLEKPFFTDTIDNLKGLFSDGSSSNKIASDEVSGLEESVLGEYPIERSFLDPMSVEPVKNSQIVTVHYIHKNPEMAANIANAIAENYINMNLERRVDAASYAKDFLNEQLVLAKSRLLESEKKLNNYARENQIVSTDDKQSLSSRRLGELSSALVKAQEERIKTESEFEQAQATANAKMLDNDVIEKLESKLAELERRYQSDVLTYNAYNDDNIRELRGTLVKSQNEYQENLATYKPAYPLMQKLQKQIRDLKNQIKIETDSINKFERNNLKRQIDEIKVQIAQQTSNISGKVTADLAAKFKAAKQREDTLRERLELQKQDLMALRDKGVGYNTLSREVETNRNLYEGLLQRLKEVGVAGGISANNISIIDPAILPYKKFKPNTKLNFTLGAVLGLFIGTVIAFLLEFLDDRIKSRDELENTLRLPSLGITPMLRKEDETSISLMSATHPTSAMAEAFRSLRTNLQFSTVDGLPHSLSVTSSMPAEAKSSTCVNMATVLAAAGKRVLLVDADLRKPTLHKRLNLNNSEGLSNYLTGQSDLSEVVQAIDIDNVFVVTAGPLSPNPTDLLSSDNMHMLMSLAPSEYDIVIVDSPPVMGLADALVIANRVSATIMIVAHNQSKKRAIVDAFRRLQQAQANIIGTIFTKAKSGSSYGHSYDYEYYYSYGQNPKSLT